jgi:PRTRC genetic system protein E
MKFFQNLEQHLDGINLNIVVTKTKDGLTVSVLPQLTCKDETKKNIVPLMCKGTAEQLDEQFITLIQKPLAEVSGFSSNLIEFEKAQEVAKEKSAITKAEKDKEVKLIKKADTCITKAEGFIEKDDIKKAILQIEAALKFYPKHKKATELLEEVKEEPKVAVIEETPIAIEEETPLPKTVAEVEEIEEAKVETPVIPIAKQEKVEAMLDEEEAIANEPDGELKEEVHVVEEVVYDKSDENGKPLRQDMEPMGSFEERLANFEAESPKAENPKATIPSDNPIEEEKSVMQEMTEQETADKEMDAMLENVKAEPKEETPKAASDDKYEILG